MAVDGRSLSCLKGAAVIPLILVAALVAVGVGLWPQGASAIAFTGKAATASRSHGVATPAEKLAAQILDGTAPFSAERSDVTSVLERQTTWSDLWRTYPHSVWINPARLPAPDTQVYVFLIHGKILEGEGGPGGVPPTLSSWQILVDRVTSQLPILEIASNTGALAPTWFGDLSGTVTTFVR